MNSQSAVSQPKFEMEGPSSEEEALRVHLSGDWRVSQQSPPSSDEVLARLTSGTRPKRVAFDAEQVTAWDSSLLTFLRKILRQCAADEIAIEDEGLPRGVRRLLRLASAVPERKGTARGGKGESWFARVGSAALEHCRSVSDSVAFIGECVLVFGRLVTGRAQFRRSDLILIIQDCGVRALGIVSLISFLVGLILAYVGSVQLSTFGAQIYVADLVAVAMTREMAVIMTAIVMAGRTGASFAAQLGTMVVNEEVDAFETMGISPIEFLVLPRMLALVLMMPLLVLYADLMGMLGGALIGVGALDLSIMEYYQQSIGAIGIVDLAIGLFKGAVFGVLVALAGCLRGMQCGRSASAVGSATTSAVVMSIVMIIVSDSLITVLCDVLGI